MTNPFMKRVDTLTDWHNKMPDANVDLLAELVLDVWKKAEEDTEERIIKLLDSLMDFETDTQRRIDHKLALHVLKDALIKGEK